MFLGRGVMVTIAIPLTLITCSLVFIDRGVMVTITIPLTLIKVPFDAYWSWCNDGFYYTIDND